jgi:hypothetical protein
MRFKSLVEDQTVEFGKAPFTQTDSVVSIKDWADGSRTVRFLKRGIITRKANVLLENL